MLFRSRRYTAGKPSASRVDLHILYFVNGKSSLTSSIDMSFFSRLLLCGRGMAARSMGSPFSPSARARLRWLYRKQYFTPTMILLGGVVSILVVMPLDMRDGNIPQIGENHAETQRDEEQQRRAGRPIVVIPGIIFRWCRRGSGGGGSGLGHIGGSEVSPMSSCGRSIAARSAKRCAGE